LLFTDPSMREADIETAMRGIYERFADYVGKNPFWKVEMPIRVEGWEREVGRWVGVR
jgi:trafficking protein particle complex subunit 4